MERKAPQYAIFCHHKGQGTNLVGSTASLPFPKAATMMTEYRLIGEFEVKLRWQFERDVCSHPTAATMWYYGLASYWLSALLCGSEVEKMAAASFCIVPNSTSKSVVWEILASQKMRMGLFLTGMYIAICRICKTKMPLKNNTRTKSRLQLFSSGSNGLRIHIQHVMKGSHTSRMAQLW